MSGTMCKRGDGQLRQSEPRFFSLGLLWVAFACNGQQTASSAFAKEMLDAHNAARSRVGVVPLKWSERLAANAQEWADTLIARNQFAHRPNSRYGSNLFEIRGASVSPAHTVKEWVAESHDYDPRTNSCRGACGHYTQIVWRSTREVGCAVSRGRGRELWVCEYDPPGNWAGRRPY